MRIVISSFFKSKRGKYFRFSNWKTGKFSQFPPLSLKWTSDYYKYLQCNYQFSDRNTSSKISSISDAQNSFVSFSENFFWGGCKMQNNKKNVLKTSKMYI